MAEVEDVALSSAGAAQHVARAVADHIPSVARDARLVVLRASAPAQESISWIA